jgi:hypothetical protein
MTAARRRLFTGAYSGLRVKRTRKYVNYRSSLVIIHKKWGRVL